MDINSWIGQQVQENYPSAKGVSYFDPFSFKRKYLDAKGKIGINIVWEGDNYKVFLHFFGSGKNVCFSSRFHNGVNVSLPYTPAPATTTPEKAPPRPNSYWQRQWLLADENLSGVEYLAKKGLSHVQTIPNCRKLWGKILLLKLDFANGESAFQAISSNGKSFLGFSFDVEENKEKLCKKDIRTWLAKPSCDHQSIYIAEGLMTAWSVWQATQCPTILGIDANNLGYIADAVRAMYPNNPIVVAADNDWKKAEEKGCENAGYKHGKAAFAVGGKFVLPKFPHKDFDDQRQSEGIVSVLSTLKEARLPHSQMPDLGTPGEINKMEEKGEIVFRNERYLSNCIQPGKLNLIRSGLGTGKTEAIAKSKYVIEGSVIAIPHLQSLTESLSQRLGLESYLILKQEIASKAKTVEVAGRLSICVNSLPKIVGGKTVQTQENYDVLVLDESEQFFRRLASPGVPKKDEIFSVLTNLLQAKTIVCSDATLSRLTIDCIEAICPSLGKTKNLVVNTYQPGIGKTIFRYECKNQLVHEAIEDIAKGSSVYFAVNSLLEAENLRAQAIAMGKKVLTITGERGEEPEVLEFKKNPDVIAKYDVVIASPAVVSGVSITKTGFHVVGLFGGGSTIAADQVQAIRRVRNPLSVRVYVQPGVKNLPTNVEQIMQSMEKGISVEKNFFSKYASDDRSTWLFKEEIQGYAKMKAIVIAYENTQKNDPVGFFCEFLRHEGFDIETIKAPLSKEEIKGYAAEAKQRKDLAIEKYCQERILPARDLSPSEAIFFEKKFKLTLAEKDCLEKFKLKQFYGALTDNEDPENWKNLLTRDKRGKLRSSIKSCESLFEHDDKFAQNLLGSEQFREQISYDQQMKSVVRDSVQKALSFLGKLPFPGSDVDVSETIHITDPSFFTTPDNIVERVSEFNECFLTEENYTHLTHAFHAEELSSMREKIKEKPLLLINKILARAGMRISSKKKSWEFNEPFPGFVAIYAAHIAANPPTP